jgi:hypothetical protein
MKTKICKKCNVKKSIDMFSKHNGFKDGYTATCTECIRKKERETYQKRKNKLHKKHAEYREKNRDNINKRAKKRYYKIKKDIRKQREKDRLIKESYNYYERNKEKVKLYQKKRYQENKDKLKKQSKLRQNKIKQNPQLYRETLDKRNIYQKKRYHSDIKIRLRNSISCGINRCIVKNQSTSKYLKLFGYTIEELKSHLESQFKLGMSWDNYGRKDNVKCWEIDHIKPVTLYDYNDEQQLIECWSLNNLQPLWAIDNKIKNDTYEGK